ncbi:MAG: S46 family peptidase [Bacteroidales bacterium]|nr:S46 family peptidase [Bacteroidales bacterium]
MRKLFTSIALLLILIPGFSVSPDEGIWIPLLIEKYNIKLMKEKGFKLSAEDIYSVNRACMKDAVVSFNGGCTAELISGEGLLITNHHCGYSLIQDHSSLEHDYLTDGFWAMSGKEELPNPGVTVTILKWMEDVTDKVLAGTSDDMAPAERERIISLNIENIQRKAVERTGYRASVKPFFMGNQYFLFVNETFRDVRLVGAPPSSIGKFGGDTDNWVWPRHTGDFSIFRVYAGKDNKPADYSPDNVPYKPAYYFPISLKGVKEGDFTMVFGYPGTTSEYVPSYHIDMVKNFVNPRLIEIRTRKIDIIDEAMNSDPLIRIQYSAKKAGISNAWKKWIGEIQGLERMKTISRKQEYEAAITKWISSDEARSKSYADILPSYKRIYDSLKIYTLVNNFTNEVLSGIESLNLSRNLRDLVSQTEKGSDPEAVNKLKDQLIAYSEQFFKDYNRETDRKLFVSMLQSYGETIEQEWLAPEYTRLKSSCNGDFASFSVKLYDKSVFTDQARFKDFIKGFNRSSVKKIKKDELYTLSQDIMAFISENVRPELARLNSEVQLLNKRYMKAQMEYESGRVFYPDANSTLRVAFGTVMGYYSRDAVYFKPVSTLKGIIEKDNPEIYDYDVPDKLKELYANKDFGRYAADGEVPVCFIANNHTTGGNSGSPVINSEGYLIGINFDRAWEGVASDMAFNPDQSRNISLDIRFALFIIDKFAGAGYLLNEMTIVE